MADAFTMPTVANAAAAKPNATARAEAGLIIVEGTALTMPFRVKVAAGGGGDAGDVERTKKAVRDRIQGFFNMAGDVFSPFNPSSDLQRCNSAPPAMAIETSNEFVDVLKLCERMYAVTGGAFDPVFAATKGARRWPGSLTIVPSTSTAANGKPQSYKVSRASKDVGVDLSAVSKGYCVDAMAESLAKEFAGFAIDPAKPRQHGPGALVEWGGDIRAVGCHPSGKPWVCAVPQHPGAATAAITTAKKPAANIDLVSAACCTSGSYAGIREGVPADTAGMGHLADASAEKASATSTETSMISATAVHASCAWADALATVVASLGSLEAAKRWIAKHAAPELGSVYQLMACPRSDGATQVQLLPDAAATPMPKPLVRELSDELRSALRPRVLMHVAIVVPIDGGRHFAAAASSFAAMRVSNKAPAAVAAGGVVARVAATHDSRLALALRNAADSGAAVQVVTVATEEPSSAAAAFLESARDGRLIESDDAAIAELCAIGTRTSLAVVASATETVGDHAVVYFTAAPSSTSEGGESTTTSAPAAVVVVGRRDNKPFAVPIPRMTARQIPVGRLPVSAMCAVVTAWVPGMKGMLATTVRNVDYTSREPARLTFDVKDSKVDRGVFGADAAHHRLHIMSGSGSQDDTLAEWFDDGTTADPASQFMYVAGASSAEAASGYRLPGCPAVSFVVDRDIQWAAAAKGGRAVIVAKPTEVEGAPTAGGSGSNLDKATPVAVARLSRFGYL